MYQIGFWIPMKLPKVRFAKPFGTSVIGDPDVYP